MIKKDFKLLKKIHDQQKKVEENIKRLKTKKNDLIDDLDNELRIYFDGTVVVDIFDEDVIKCFVLVDKVDLKKLEKVKKDLKLENIILQPQKDSVGNYVEMELQF